MKREIVEEINYLRSKYGRGWRKLYKVKVNYPFGRKSTPKVKIIKRVKSK